MKDIDERFIPALSGRIAEVLLSTIGLFYNVRYGVDIIKIQK